MQGQQDHRHPRQLMALTLLAVAIGLYLRFGNLLGNPLWLDEAYTAFAAEKGLDFIWQVTPQYEVHPPFYYALMSVWTQALGTSLLAYRAVGILAGVASLPLLWMIGTQIAGRLRWNGTTLPCLLVALGALSPILVQMSREVRPYPLMILVYGVGLLMVLRLGNGPARTADRLAYLACLILLLWLHTLGPIFAGSLALALLILTWRRNWTAKDYAVYLILHLTAGLFWAPAIAILLYQADGWVESSWLGFSWSGLPSAIAQTYGVTGSFVSIVALLLLGMGLRALRVDGRLMAALVTLAALPVAGALIATLSIAPVFIPRTLSPAAIPALVLMAVGASYLAGQRLLLAKSLPAIFALALAITALPLATRQREQDWYDVYAKMQPLIRPGDVILAYPNESALPLRYAARDRGRSIAIRALPVEVPAPPNSGPHPTGTRGVVAVDAPYMRATTKTLSSVPTIWLVQINPRLFDAEDRFGSILSQSRTLRVDWKTADTRVRAFTQSETTPSEQAQP
jgi:mannosyltransferase